MNRVSVLGPLLLTSIALGGCSTLAGRAGENGSEAWVARVYRAGEMPPNGSGCAENVDLSAYRNDQFVLVREPHGKHTVSVVAHVPHGMQLQAGDEVEIEPTRCSKGVMPEVKQIFKQ